MLSGWVEQQFWLMKKTVLPHLGNTLIPKKKEKDIPLTHIFICCKVPVPFLSRPLHKRRNWAMVVASSGQLPPVFKQSPFVFKANLHNPFGSCLYRLCSVWATERLQPHRHNSKKSIRHKKAITICHVMHIPFIHLCPSHNIPSGDHPVTSYNKVIPSPIIPWDFSLLKQYNIFVFQMFPLKIISIVYQRLNCSKMLATTNRNSSNTQF